MILFIGFFVVVFGLCVGSFLNAVIYRLSFENFSFWKDLGGANRSYCPHCRHALAWNDLIPLVSFFWLKGKCRYCNQKISIQYPLIEISTVLIFIAIFNYQSPVFNFLNIIFLFYIASSLIVIFVYDLKHYLIPDIVLFPAIGVALVYRIFNFGYWNLFGILDLGFGIFPLALNYIFAATVGFSFFSLIFLISRGIWMGFGDCKLAVLLGLILGWPNIFVGLFLAFFFGAIIGVSLMILSKKGLKSEMPFAPFLIAGTGVAFFYGNQIISWYMDFFKF